MQADDTDHEVRRYVKEPGQAVPYYMGYMMFKDLRAKYDDKPITLHRAILSMGERPMSVILKHNYPSLSSSSEMSESYS